MAKKDETERAAAPEAIDPESWVSRDMTRAIVWQAQRLHQKKDPHAVGTMLGMLEVLKADAERAKKVVDDRNRQEDERAKQKHERIEDAKRRKRGGRDRQERGGQDRQEAPAMEGTALTGGAA